MMIEAMVVLAAQSLLEEDSNSGSTGANFAGPPPKNNARPRAKKLLGGFLAAMVAIYGILTANLIYSAARAGSLANDNNVFALSYLNDSSELNLSARFQIEHDSSLFEQIQVHNLSGSDPEVIDFLYTRYSAEAQDSLSRSGELDGVYYDKVYLCSNVERDLSVRSIDLALAWSQREDAYLALATVLAVGLAFAAWGSLMEGAGWVRWLFAVVAALILAASVGSLVTQITTQEPLEESISFDGNYEDYTFVTFDPF